MTRIPISAEKGIQSIKKIISEAATPRGMLERRKYAGGIIGETPIDSPPIFAFSWNEI